MGRCWTVSVAIVGVILALIVGHLLVKLGFTNTFTAVDSATCTRVGHGLFHGSEDVALVRRGRYLVSSGDVIPLLEGAPRIPAGSIVCVDMGGDAVSAFTVPLTGLPAGVAFQPHGLSYSNETGLLFAVSHGLSAGGLSRVVILELSGADAEDPREMSLRYRGSVTSPFFGNGALNNLAAGFVPGELFVSEWLQVGGTGVSASERAAPPAGATTTTLPLRRSPPRSRAAATPTRPPSAWPAPRRPSSRSSAPAPASSDAPSSSTTKRPPRAPSRRAASTARTASHAASSRGADGAYSSPTHRASLSSSCATRTAACSPPRRRSRSTSRSTTATGTTRGSACSWGRSRQSGSAW